MCLALQKLRKDKIIKRPVLNGMLAAISVGIVEGQPVHDLD